MRLPRRQRARRGNREVAMSDFSGSTPLDSLLGEVSEQENPELSRVGAFHPGVNTCMNAVLSILAITFVGILASLVIRINQIADVEETEANKARQRDDLNPLWGTDGAILLILLLMIILRQRLVDVIASCMGTSCQCCERRRQSAPSYNSARVVADLEHGSGSEGDIEEAGVPRRRQLAEGKNEDMGLGDTLSGLDDVSVDSMAAQRRRMPVTTLSNLSVDQAGSKSSGSEENIFSPRQRVVVSSGRSAVRRMSALQALNEVSTSTAAVQQRATRNNRSISVFSASSEAKRRARVARASMAVEGKVRRRVQRERDEMGGLAAPAQVGSNAPSTTMETKRRAAARRVRDNMDRASLHVGASKAVRRVVDGLAQDVSGSEGGATHEAF